MDNKIKKAALNCSSGCSCDNCLYTDRGCRGLVTDLLKINNNQKAEVERLEKQVVYLKALNKRSDKYLHVRLVETAKQEAIKEFAERLKTKIGDLHFQNYGLAILEINYLVQEMVGE